MTKFFAILALLLPLGAQAGGTSKCTVEEKDGVTTRNFSYDEPSDDGTIISAVYVHGVKPSNGTTGSVGSSDSTLRVRIGTDEVFTQTLSVTDNKTQKTMNWGPIIRGISSATVDVVDSGVSGVLDKRQFVVKDKSLSFLDGGKPPAVTFPKGLDSTLTSFAKRMFAALDQCAPNRTETAETGLPRVQPRGLDRFQDHGHHSWTYDSWGCKGCKIGAMAGVILAEAVCVAGTCWWSFGIGCVACTTTAATAAVAAIQGCEWSGACCPLTCGSGSFPLNPPSCCFGGETCLDQHGQCCSQGKQACVGKTCCSASQSCITKGIQKGTCCPDEAVCGDTCCPSDNDKCVSGSCCKSTEVCGNACCNPTPTDPNDPGFLMNYCANKAKSLCCPVGQSEVGSTGICCPTGEVLINGICCSPGGNICGGQCCKGTCTNGKCDWDVSDADCISLGWTAGACKNHYPSKACATCYSGCCAEVPS